MTGQRSNSDELRARMVQRLAANSYLGQWEAPFAPWWPALAAVPRHRYIPDDFVLLPTIWLQPVRPAAPAPLWGVELPRISVGDLERMPKAHGLKLRE